MTNITTICKMKSVYKNWCELLFRYALKNRLEEYATILTRSGSTFIAPIKDMLYTVNSIWVHKIYGHKPRGVVVDIGANIGAYTIYASETADKVYAFEPVPSTFRILKHNCKMLRNVTISNYAIGSKNDMKVMHLNKRDGDSSFYPIENESKQISVFCVSLDNWLTFEGIERIDTLKLDCEGAEYEILYSSNKLHIVNRIVMEYHLKEETQRLIGYLQGKGFKLRRWDAQNKILDFGRI